MELYSGGPSFTFVAASGNAVDGVEFGAVAMNVSPTGFVGRSPTGDSIQVDIAESLLSATYEYRRTAPESGQLIISGVGVVPPPVGEDPRLVYMGNEFARSFNILFATRGASISAVNISDRNIFGPDPDPEEGIPQRQLAEIIWNNPTIRLFGGGQVPVGWTLESSQALSRALPKVYPNSISNELFLITPSDEELPPMDIYLLESNFTRFLPGGSTGTSLEERGVGRLERPDLPDVTINYSYRPVASSTQNVILEIVGDGISFTLDMSFQGFQSGTYTSSDGSSGTFQFPFLEGAL